MLVVWFALISCVVAQPLPQIFLVPGSGFEEIAEADRMKRDPLGFNARGFHDDIFGQDFGVFHTVKRSQYEEEPAVAGLTANENVNNRFKRDVENEMKPEAEHKRRPEMGSSGFHGDTFSGGFGEFWTMKKKESVKRDPEVAEPVQYGDIWSEKRDGNKPKPGVDSADEKAQNNAKLKLDNFALAVGLSLPSELNAGGSDSDAVIEHEYGGSISKRRPDMDSSGFHGDTFSGGFGDFWTMKKKGDYGLHVAETNAATTKKRRPEMGASGFHGDTFSNGFGDFWTMKRSLHDEALVKKILNLSGFQKRRPEMGASGYHGDTFSNGFGEFWTMKKKNRSPIVKSDSLDSGLGELYMSKRRPEMDFGGFHGDTFSGGFGDFWPMKKFEDGAEPAGMRQEFSTEDGDCHGQEKGGSQNSEA